MNEKTVSKWSFHWMKIEFNILAAKTVSKYFFTEWKLNLIYWMKKLYQMIFYWMKIEFNILNEKTISKWSFYWMKIEFNILNEKTVSK